MKAHPNYDKEYYHKDLKKSRAYSKKYKDKHLEKVRERARNRVRKYSAEINDQYIKGVLSKQTGLAYKEIPVPLIKLKKIQIKAIRTIKLKQNEPH